jgi:hypothetical protein
MSQMRFVSEKSTDNMLRVAVRDSGGAGRTGLSSSTTNLAICVEGLGGTPVLYSYTVGDGTIESISTLGTYQAPSTDKIRFKEVADSRFPGLYELHFPDDMFNPGDKTHSFTLSILGASNMLGELIHIQFAPFDTNARQIGAVDVQSGVGEPTGARSNWSLVDWISFLGRFVANKMTLNRATAEMIVYRDDGVTSLSEQAVSDDGDVQTRDAMS